MLKGIPKILSPELLKVLCEMGHSDRIVLADGTLPYDSMGKNAIVLRYDSCNIPELLDAILQVFPLDTYVDTPVSLMALMDRDVGRWSALSSTTVPAPATPSLLRGRAPFTPT